MRVNLTGGLPLKSLRIFEIRDGEEDGLENTDVNTLFPDTWPLEDLLHDIFSQNFDSDFDVLASSLQFICRSAVASALVHDAARQGWEIGLAHLEGTEFHIDVPEGKIILNNDGLSACALARSPFYRHAVVGALLRALRDVWHERRHGGFDEKFAPEGVLMLERIRAADCEVIAALCAWEIKENGYDALWKHLIAADDGDIAEVFAATLQRHAGTPYPLHKALAAAFDQWHQGAARVTQSDHETLEYLDAVMRQYGNGALGRGKPQARDVEVLSCLPDRTAYLQNLGAEILRGPLYAGLSDPVNQSHFMQLAHDASATTVQGVSFRDSKLAARIFPGGEMTPDSAVSETSSS